MPKHYRNVNYSQMLYHAYRQTFWNISSLIIDEKFYDFSNGLPYQITDDSDIDDLIKSVDPARLEGLELIRCDYATPTLQDSAAYQTNQTRMASVYGADDIVEYIALFRHNGEYYLAGFQLINYGGSWGIWSLTSLLASTQATGTMRPISEDTYMEGTQ